MALEIKCHEINNRYHGKVQMLSCVFKKDAEKQFVCEVKHKLAFSFYFETLFCYKLTWYKCIY